jgi:hypothetical protein
MAFRRLLVTMKEGTSSLLTGLSLGLTIAGALYVIKSIAKASREAAYGEKSSRSSAASATASDTGAVAYESLIGNTPLVLLREASRISGCNIYVKMECMNPGGTGKDRAGAYMRACV